MKGKLLATTALILKTSAALAFFPGVGGAPQIYLTASPTSIAAQWTTSGSGSTAVAGGTTAGTYNTNAVDNGTQTSVTQHHGILAGLTPGTRYYVQGTTVVGGVTTNVTASIVTPAAPVTVALTSAVFSAGVTASAGHNSGDTYGSTTNASGLTVMAADDTTTCGNGGSTPMMVASISAPNFVCANINVFSNYGVEGAHPKFFGMAFYNNILYGIESSICFDNTAGCTLPAPNIYTQQFGVILKSPDNGVTWALPGAPTSYSANPAVPSNALSMFDPLSGCSQSTFVMHGPDNGKWLPDIRIDNADAYKFFLCTSPVTGQASTGYQFNGDKFFSARVPLAQMANLDGSKFQYFIGGPNGNGVDGNLDAAWSSSYSGAAPLLTNLGKISNSQMQYMPTTGRYVILNWYWPNPGTWNVSTRLTYECAHPWSCTSTPIEGPTNLGVGNLGNGVCSFYNATVYPPSAMTATRGGNAMTLFGAGDFSNGGTLPCYQLYLINAVFSLNDQSENARAG